ncbi:hypothetical protein EH196_19260 [Bacillus sp. C1-1]|nr:hypothetical protein EH196_19260 [Bacillus sp. C1-1]
MRVAFIAPSFGFGPASKADYIIKALRHSVSSAHIDFYGSSFALEYITNNSPVNNIYECDYSKDKDLLMENIIDYDFVINIMEMEILTHWDKNKPKMLLIDSLNWMWDKLPKGIENVSKYYVQDFMLEEKNLKLDQLEIIRPITFDTNNYLSKEKENMLLVNFSGMCNPFTSQEYFKKYVCEISEIIINLFYDEFDEIVFTTNSSLKKDVEVNFKSLSKVKFLFLKHADFLEYMQRSRVVFSTPGITITLEARELDIDLKYLLPTNYSQVLLSNKYLNEDSNTNCIRLEDFGKNYELDKDMKEDIAVAKVNKSVIEILSTMKEKLYIEILRIYNNDQTKKNSLKKESILGQSEIIDSILKMYGDKIDEDKIPIYTNSRGL